MAFRTNKTPVLQTKSASGAVATFNTALAMPLASCNIAVNAWQEGSGEPSPVNVRPIHGFDKVRVGMVNFNQLVLNGNFTDNSVWLGYYGSLTIANNKGTLTCQDNSAFPSICQTVNMVQNHKYLYLADYTTNKDTTVLAYYRTEYNFCITNTLAGVKTRAYSIFNNVSSKTTGNLQIYCNRANPRTMEAGDTCIYECISLFDLTAMFGENIANYLYSLERQTAGAGVAIFKQLFYKDYYAYNAGGTWVSVASVNGDNYPDYAEINLGQDVYGGVYNSVTGKLRLTHGYSEVLSSWLWSKSTSYPGGYFVSVSFTHIGAKDFTPFKCSHAKSVDRVDLYVDGTCFCDGSLNFRLMTEPSTIDDWKAYLDSQKANNTPVYICYELAEPIEIQLTPQQIETLIGNNTIFADTGDIDLTFKDLDIAKRGNFREVFKLPS